MMKVRRNHSTSKNLHILLANQTLIEHQQFHATLIQPNEISDQFLLESVRSLNDKQRSAYNTVVSW